MCAVCGTVFATTGGKRSKPAESEVGVAMGKRWKCLLPVALCVAGMVACCTTPVAADAATTASPEADSTQALKPVPMTTPTVTVAEPPGATEAKLSNDSKASESAYRIQPGDTISLTVPGVPEYSGTFTVRPDGTILLQDEMVSSIAIGGCTEKEAAATVTSKIGEYVKDPTVVLTISRFRVMVVGEVRNPGQYELSSGARLLEAVERAGGVKDDQKDLSRVYLTKASGAEEAYNLKRFKEKADTSQNPVVEPGDKVSVGKGIGSKEIEFKVTGAVAKPGTYQLDEEEGTRVSDAIKEAGRWTQDANAKAALLMRKDGTKRTIDLSKLDLDPGDSDNVALAEGDELFVPRNTTEVNVLGGVKKPGPYRVPPGTTLLEVISMAGGLEEGAILKDCVVVRNVPRPSRIAADLERLTKQGDMSQNPVVGDRDVVFVPARPTATKAGGSNTWQVVTDNAWRLLMLMRYRWYW
jgi:polysaccharide export outer membrane protein